MEEARSLRSKVMSAIWALSLLMNIVLTSIPLDAYAAVPSSIAYQGRLRESDGSAIADGSYDFIFELYDAVSGGTLIETYTHDAGGLGQIAVENGYFSTNLAIADADLEAFSGEVWLEITVDGSVATEVDDDPLVTRVQLLSAPYAQFTRAIENASSAPVTGLYNGRVYFDTTSGQAFVYDEGSLSWEALGAGAATNIYTTDGTVLANRTVTMGGNSITFDGTGDIILADSGLLTSVGLTSTGTITQTGAVNITGASSFTGNITQVSGNIDASASSGTFSSGTGNITLNGATSVSGTNT